MVSQGLLLFLFPFILSSRGWDGFTEDKGERKEGKEKQATKKHAVRNWFLRLVLSFVVCFLLLYLSVYYLVYYENPQ